MNKRILSLIILLVLLVGNVSVALAYDFRFQVESLNVEFIIEEDGTATIDYDYVFINNGSDPIDAVDIGMPLGASYSLSDATAEIDGSPVDRIIQSPYVAGIAAEFPSRAIRTGQTGRVHVRIRNVGNVLYPGEQEEDEPYVSFQFQPNYFDSDFVSGTTNMTVTLRLPPGLEPHEPTYYNPQKWPGVDEPQASIDDQGRVSYTWQSNEARSDREYIFGGGFPARVVPEVAVITAPPVAGPTSSTDAGELLCCAGFALLFGGIFAFSIYQATVGAKKRKLAYLPPKITIEGHGIKRGLTSVEAAVLLEQPIDKIMTMILFSTVKKNAATVLTRDPLKIEVERPMPDKLHPYEVEFLKAMEETNKKEQRKLLQDVMVNLIKGVTNKMKGFSRKESVAYYEDIIKRAWEQVEVADTPDVKMEKFDEYMGWTMLDRDFDRRTRDTFGPRPVFVPMWWGRYDPVYRSSGGGLGGGGSVSAPTSAPVGGGKVSLPHLPGSDFAASMVGGIQSFSAGVIGDLTNFTESITNKTNPLPPTSTQRSGWKGGGGGGGRSCACACACAGCACACAGGGR
jgi:hypothetical protein